MLIILKRSFCFVSVLVTVNSFISGNCYKESNYELNQEICGPEFIYCSESNVCLKAECIRNNLIVGNQFNTNNDYCPPQTNYCNQTDECLPHCPKISPKQDNRYVLKSNENSQNDKLNNTANVKENSMTTEFTSDNMTTVAKVKYRSVISITMSIDADFETFIDDNLTSTKVHLTNQLTQMFHISKSKIIDLVIISGSVFIKFNVSNNGQIDKQELVNKNYTITDIKGKHYSVRSVSSELYLENIPPNDSNEPESENSVTEESNTAQELSSVQTEITSFSTEPMSLKELKTNVTTEVVISKTTPSIPKMNTTVGESVTEMMTTMTAMSSESTSIDPNLMISMTITIEGDYDTVVGGDKQQFLTDVKKQLANYLRVPLICIINMDSKSGSIVVIFELIPSKDPNFIVNRDAIKAAKLEFELKIKQNQVLIVDSAGNSHKVLSSFDYSGGDNSGHKTENDLSYEGSYLILGLAIGAIVIMVVLIIVTACVVRSYMYRKYNRQIRPRTPSELMTTDSPQNEGISSANTMRMSEGITREGASSLGHYSYDSGVWVGTVPEPVGHNNVPEPPNYLPPNQMEISITPKPPPDVLKRLRKEWKSDGDNCAHSAFFNK